MSTQPIKPGDRIHFATGRVAHIFERWDGWEMLTLCGQGDSVWTYPCEEEYPLCKRCQRRIKDKQP
jgi:hypothetical protein